MALGRLLRSDKMVKLINRLTGSVVNVDEARVNEYTAAGHRLAAVAAPVALSAQEKPAKKTRKTKKAGG